MPWCNEMRSQGRQLQSLVPVSSKGQNGEEKRLKESNESKHVNAWASPRSSNPSHTIINDQVPEEVHLKFRSTGSANDVIWCPLTHMWHCRMGAELVVSLTAKPSDQESDQHLQGTFCLFLSNQEGNSAESQLIMYTDGASNSFSTTWIGQRHGQTDFHAKWLDEPKQLQAKRNLRVFANAASLCVHPNWQDADPTCTELMDVELLSASSGASCGASRAWLLCCHLQLRESHGGNLRCPSRVPVLEIAGPSFGGLGPDTNRWKPAIPGFVSKVIKSEVDIKRGHVVGLVIVLKNI